MNGIRDVCQRRTAHGPLLLLEGGWKFINRELLGQCSNSEQVSKEETVLKKLSDKILQSF